MIERDQIYKCFKCGEMAQIIHAGNCEMHCCDVQMRLMGENTEDASTEKHVPVVEIDGDTVRVVVGSVLHPMDDDHHIEWIELISGDKAYRQYLNPGDEPKAEFKISESSFTVREFCNLHGMWKIEWKG